MSSPRSPTPTEAALALTYMDQGDPGNRAVARAVLKLHTCVCDTPHQAICAPYMVEAPDAWVWRWVCAQHDAPVGTIVADSDVRVVLATQTRG